jgi:O-antigen/teichoic acid export membrane protein
LTEPRLGSATPRREAGPRLAAGLAHLLTGRGITLAVQFVTLAVMGRELGPSGFGTIQLGVAIFVYVGFVNDLGLTLLGAREFGGGHKSDATHGDLLGARLALTAVAMVPVITVLATAPMDDTTRAVALILSGGFIISSLNLRWLLQASERFAWIAAADTAGAVVQLATTWLFVHGPGDTVMAAIVVVSGPAVSTLVMAVMAPADRTLIPRFHRTGLRLLRQALPLGVATIATAIYYSLDSILIGVFRGTEEVGYYAAAYRIVLAGLTLPFMAHAAALPLVSRLTREEPASVSPVLAGLTKSVLLFVIPLAVGTTMCADVIVRTAFGVDFGPSAGPLRILIWTCVTVGANVAFAVLLLARGRDRVYMLTTILGAGANGIANIAMIPAFGMIGAAATTMLAEILVLSSIVWHTRDVSFGVLGRSLVKVVPPTVIMGAVIAPIRDSLVSVPVGVVSFGIAALIFRAVRLSDLRAFVAAFTHGTPDAGGAST